MCNVRCCFHPKVVMQAAAQQAGTYVCCQLAIHVVTYAHYACVADCADAMADAWRTLQAVHMPVACM